ncbi:carbamoyltransferase HypF [Thermogemmatispora sp.]|uniref:carbamoyltransferase HypF n=1 Tax=Thermogemmatispora sp. TaxID=1968838 RepID=UPI001D2E38B8|nr:carbamoyltransferase HypF [Thermogemmatispora sp.]MBX5448515.1 carbamoyltransferase HypF [Thermogemmatispora sp.]
MTARQRQRLTVKGLVQGVGFRPFVYGLAQRLHLAGFVFNDSRGVTIEIEGPEEALTQFRARLQMEAPPLARIERVTVETLPLRQETAFVITESREENERAALISPDMATCTACLRELFDPADRRYRYPFINCTNCGPRFTIIQDIPYDREQTTMRVFSMCPACRAEYEDPANRRFHAQPNACPQCGPQIALELWDEELHALELAARSNGEIGEEATLIEQVARLLARGAILAIKGLGGYHLACDALNAEAVQRLRRRKHREAKPFALMVPDLETAQRLCYISEAEAALLQSPRRPIVLLEQRPNSPVAPAVAPGYRTLGLMLPYTPLHHLLLQAFAQAIAPGRLPVLVMTSGNISDEPIAYRDDEARRRLAAIADGMLTHNRLIHMRCDDSVTRLVAGGEQLFRRSRGYVPEPIPLAFELPRPVLACGGHLKNTFCLGKGRQAFLGHHIGDLENLETLASFREGIQHFQRLFDIVPEAVAYDLHPDYLATRYALDSGLEPRIGVQHHHAHIASVLAEHGLNGPVIGIAADGTGYGPDGAIWGCEVLLADLYGFERLAHLAYVPLPGGEQAVRQPWRMAAVYLARTYGERFLTLDIPFARRLDRSTWRILAQMIARGLNSLPTSSLGRLFDAVAAILGLRDEVLYEGQAAIELEMLASSVPPDEQPSYPYVILRPPQGPLQIDVAPLLAALVEDLQRGYELARIARRFHRSLVAIFSDLCQQIRERTGLAQVALSGGAFQNRLLLEDLVSELQASGFAVYLNRRVPPNDGGLSLGQLAVAAARLAAGEGRRA